ncbi:hypothetical protein ACFSKW_00190 [Nonomuraea mangrovi]|uniref:Uncharacterized protein n=1 Tax=Nonomuraea mangrovi TaxID=2316207 RepID=A0ABW4SLM4_9ACTN
MAIARTGLADVRAHGGALDMDVIGGVTNAEPREDQMPIVRRGLSPGPTSRKRMDRHLARQSRVEFVEFAHGVGR